MKGRGLTTGILLALTLSGCAAALMSNGGAQRPTRTSLPLPTRECVFVRSIRDFRPLDEYNLLIWGADRNKPYLLEFNTRCPGLRYADTIGIADRTTDGRLCAFGSDTILVRDAGTTRRCSIGSIRSMNSEEVGLIRDEFD